MRTNRSGAVGILAGLVQGVACFGANEATCLYCCGLFAEYQGVAKG